MTDKDKSEAVKVTPFEFDLMQKDTSKEQKTNALGYAKNWYEESLKPQAKEGEEPKEESNLSITIEELEKIRKDAYDDGFKEGKDEGFKVGYDEGFSKGKEEGFPKGVDEGLQDGLKQGEQIIVKEAARLSRYANHLVKPIADFDKEISSELIYLASRLAKAFIKEELKVSHKFLENSIWEIMRLLPMANGKVNIYVNPQDLPKIQGAINNPDIVLATDGSLGPGDLRADVGLSSIDIMQEDRIDSFINDFLVLNNERKDEAPKDRSFSANDTYKDVDLIKDEVKEQKEQLKEDAQNNNENPAQEEEDPWAQFADELNEVTNADNSQEENTAVKDQPSAGGKDLAQTQAQTQSQPQPQSLKDTPDIKTKAQGGISVKPVRNINKEQKVEDKEESAQKMQNISGGGISLEPRKL